MSDPKVHAILLIPAEGDPHDLLTEGPCGARPPEMFYDPGSEGLADWRPNVGRSYAVQQCPRALVLAREGKPVRTGIFQLNDAPDVPVDFGTIEFFIQHTLLYGEVPRRTAPSVEAFGVILLLDKDDRDVAHSKDRDE